MVNWALWVSLIGGLAVVVGIVLLVFFLLPKLWAVARHTISEALRMKLAVFFIVLMALGFWGATQSQGDGTVSGRIQSFLVYSMTAIAVLLSLLSIFLSRSLSDELVNKQIMMLMTKPIARWQFLLGKWLGIVLLDAGILVVTGLGIYGTVYYLSKQPPLNELDERRLEHEVLTARHASSFVPPDFTQRARAIYEERLKTGAYDLRKEVDPEEEQAKIRKELEGRWRSVPHGEQRIFFFENVLTDPDPENVLQVRYKAKAIGYPPDEIVRSRWVAGSARDDTVLYAQNRRDVVDRYHTMTLPADVITDERTLSVLFQNFNPFPGEPQYRNYLIFEGSDAVEVLFEVGSFEGNLARALFLVQCRLMFLTAVGLLFASIFSFPVATLCSITVYVLAATREFVQDAFRFMITENTAETFFKQLFPYLLKVFYTIIPNFSHYSGLEMLAEGRNVTLAWVLLGLGKLGLLTAGVLLLACLLFYRREVAEVSV